MTTATQIDVTLTDEIRVLRIERGISIPGPPGTGASYSDADAIAALQPTVDELEQADADEAASRSSADSALSGLVGAEAAARADDDSALAASIAAEASARASADSSEASTRAGADSGLQSAIDAEATARAAAIDALGSAAAADVADFDPAGAAVAAVADHVADVDPHGDRAYVDSIATTKADLVGGKVPTSELPAIAITSRFVVNTQAAMLALAAEEGDVAIRTDLSKSFILGPGDPTVLASWSELLTPTDAVTDEAAAREAADLALQAAIDAEAAARIDADGLHDFWLNGLANDLSAEIAARQAARFVSSVGLGIDGQGLVISAGPKGFVPVPYAGTIIGWMLLADVVGSIVVDVWKDTLAHHPPTVADSIAGSNKPALASAIEASGGVAGWSTSVVAGDVIMFNVDSAATVTKISLALQIERALT